MIVLVDRYIHSSLAYQGHARGLGLEDVAKINRFAMAGAWPDATILLELSPEEAGRRRQARDGEKADRIEETGGDFMARVAEGFEVAAQANARDLLRVSADGDPDEVVRVCLKALRAELPLGCGCAPGTVLCPH
jgi:dTMP kinase